MFLPDNQFNKPKPEWPDTFSPMFSPVTLPAQIDGSARSKVQVLADSKCPPQPDETGTSSQHAALGAEFADMPAEHGGAPRSRSASSGDMTFTFTVRFSESFPISYVTMRDHAFTVTNGRVTRARRLDNPHHENQGMQPNREWEIAVAPDTGAREVTITLPETTDCAATGAICTEDGTMLSGTVSATVPHTDAGPTIDAAPAPLTVQFENVPAEHDGGNEFAVELRFSEPPAGPGLYGARNIAVRNAIEITGGAVVSARSIARNGAHRRIVVQPNGTGAVTLSLPPGGPACDQAGALCTEAGGRLEAGALTQIRGPAGLSVADAEVEEGPGVALAFTVSLSRAASETVTVDWATADGTATAGSDYTADSGSLAFAPGETWKTVSVAVLDDSHDEGSETMRLVLSNPTGAYLADGEATGTIENTDPMPQAWLGRFGRTVAEQVLDAVGTRLRVPPRAGVEATLAGQALPRWDGEAGPDAADGMAARRMAGEAEAQAEVAALSDWLQGGRVDAGDGRRAAFSSRAVTERDLLTGSSFALTAQTSGGAGGLVSLWGRGSVSRFDGSEGDLSLDGEVASAMLGADWTRDAWTTGLLLSHSRGEGGYSGAGAGTVSSSMTGLYPYGRTMVNERVTLWGVAGYGAGTLTLTPKNPGTGKDDGTIRTDMDLAMAALGVRGVAVAAPADGGFELAVTSDGMVVRTSSEKVAGLEAAEAEVTRLRLGLEGAWRGIEAGGGALRPRLEVGVRHDGGDAETGFGLDLGGGLAWSHPANGVSAEMSGRALLTHESRGFRDRGLSGSFAWDPGQGSGRGPKVTLTQTMGAPARGGLDALLGRTTLAGLAANDNGDELENRRLELKLGYGLPAFGDRFTSTPELGLGLSNGHRGLQAGVAFQPGRGRSNGVGTQARGEPARKRQRRHGARARRRAAADRALVGAGRQASPWVAAGQRIRVRSGARMPGPTCGATPTIGRGPGRAGRGGDEGERWNGRIRNRRNGP